MTSSLSFPPHFSGSSTTQESPTSLEFRRDPSIPSAFCGSTMIKVAKANPLASTFTFINCITTDSQETAIAFSHLTKLKSVTLEGRGSYNSNMLKALGERNLNLKHLSITDESPKQVVDLAPIHSIIGYCRQLESLHLRLPKKTFNEKELKQFMELTKLHLRSFTLETGSGVHLRHVKILTKQAPQLEECSLTVAKKCESAIEKRLKGKKFTLYHSTKKP